MPNFIDQTGQVVFVKQHPQRIVSLVPSQTELLYDLGLDEEVVGITKFCLHPANWFRNKTRVGGTKQLKMDIIRKLEPDLVIANKEENVREQIEELRTEFPVWVSDVSNLSSAIEMIGQIGNITEKQQAANSIIDLINGTFQSLPITNEMHSAIYLIWQKPYMTAGGDTLIHAMMGYAGFDNLYSIEKRYPEITLEEIRKLHPAYLLLSSEPYPFGTKHVEELKALLPGVKVKLVDGEMFSWYGSRLVKAGRYLGEVKST